MASRRLREQWKQTCHLLGAIGQATGNKVTWKTFYPFTDHDE